MTSLIPRLGAVYVLIAASILAQKETFVPPNDVSFGISADQQKYRAGERIRFRYRITNVSNAPLHVPREWEVKCPANPHIWAWFENSSGQHFIPGYAVSCSPQINSQSIRERMSKEAVLLKPKEHVDGRFELDTTLFGGLKPGVYRIEVLLSGWSEGQFTAAELSELALIPGRFMRGEVPSSIRITLLP